MIEIFTSGFFVGQPHGVGGAGAIVNSEAGEIARVKRVFGPAELTTSIGAELAVLADALEKTRAAGGGGEKVIVRTGYASLADLCRGRIPRGAAELAGLIARLGEVARDFEELQAIVSPGWVTARPHDLAVRAILDQIRNGTTGNTIGTRGESTPSPSQS